MKQKILIVDDEYGIVDMMKSYFQARYEVLTAYSGKEALEKAARNPKLILLDINMPEMDGLAVCRRLREYISCPILFLTARVESADKISGFQAGADGRLVSFRRPASDGRGLGWLQRAPFSLSRRRHCVWPGWDDNLFGGTDGGTEGGVGGVGVYPDFFLYSFSGLRPCRCGGLVLPPEMQGADYDITGRCAAHQEAGFGFCHSGGVGR